MVIIIMLIVSLFAGISVDFEEVIFCIALDAEIYALISGANIAFFAIVELADGESFVEAFADAFEYTMTTRPIAKIIYAPAQIKRTIKRRQARKAEAAAKAAEEAAAKAAEEQKLEAAKALQYGEKLINMIASSPVMEDALHFYGNRDAVHATAAEILYAHAYYVVSYDLACRKADKGYHKYGEHLRQLERFATANHVRRWYVSSFCEEQIWFNREQKYHTYFQN